MVESSRQFIRVLVDCTVKGSHEELRKKYAIRGFPTLVFADSKGNAVESMVGFRKTEDVLTQFTGAIEKHTAGVAKTPDNVDTKKIEAAQQQIAALVEKRLAAVKEGLERKVEEALKAETEKGSPEQMLASALRAMIREEMEKTLSGDQIRKMIREEIDKAREEIEKTMSLEKVLRRLIQEEMKKSKSGGD